MNAKAKKKTLILMKGKSKKPPLIDSIGCTQFEKFLLWEQKRMQAIAASVAKRNVSKANDPFFDWAKVEPLENKQMSIDQRYEFLKKRIQALNLSAGNYHKAILSICAYLNY